MTTNARIGYDTRFAIEDAVGSGVYVALAEVFTVTPPSGTIDQIDATHMQSADRTREFIPGLKDPGSASAEMNYVPNSATDQRLSALEISGETLSMRITYPNGVTVTFPASVESYEKAIPLDDKMTAVITLKVSGAVVMAAAAAPTNTTAPAISGVAQVGVTLTAWEGIWTNNPSFGFQWQEEISTVWTNIAGATARTYVPVVGSIGRPLRVVVTGTNTAGSASANSVETADIIAA
jgi:predicted secreted protein